MLPIYGDGESLAGNVLAAHPSLLDPNFKESLIFLAEHNEEGAFGLILNRPTGKTLGDVVKSESLPSDIGNIPLFLGGPVSTDNILVAAFAGNEGKITCKLTGGTDDIAPYLSDTSTHVRAFAGYSGWGGGQLEVELEGTSWKVCPAHQILFKDEHLPSLWTVFTNEDTRWKKMIGYLPDDPSLN